MKRFVHLSTFAPLLCVLAFSITNSQVKSLTAEQLAEQADVVAIGRVSSCQPEWSQDGKRILTRVTIGVEQRLKGNDAESPIIVEVPGGEIGTVGETYSHTARFAVDENVVVFANRGSDGKLRLTGGDQGKIVVHTDAASGRKLVRENELLEVFTARVTHAIRAQHERELR